MNKQCEHIQEMLPAYTLGDLSEAQAAEVKAHLDTCGDCQAALRQIGPTLDVLRDALAAPSSAPARLSDERRRRIFAAAPVSAKTAEGGWRGIIRWTTEAHPNLRRAAAMVLVGVIVLAFLATGLVVNFSGKSERAIISATRASEAALSTAVEVYKQDTGHYPASLEDLAGNDGSPNWHGPYVRGGVPSDPWGKKFDYKITANGFEVKSPTLEGKTRPGGELLKGRTDKLESTVVTLGQRIEGRQEGEEKPTDTPLHRRASDRESLRCGVASESSAPAEVAPQAEGNVGASFADALSGKEAAGVDKRRPYEDSDSDGYMAGARYVPSKPQKKGDVNGRQAGEVAQNETVASDMANFMDADKKPKEEMVPLKLKLPKPMFVGTPVPISVANLEPARQKAASPEAPSQPDLSVASQAANTLDGSLHAKTGRQNAPADSVIGNGTVSPAGSSLSRVEKEASARVDRDVDGIPSRWSDGAPRPVLSKAGSGAGAGIQLRQDATPGQERRPYEEKDQSEVGAVAKGGPANRESSSERLRERSQDVGGPASSTAQTVADGFEYARREEDGRKAIAGGSLNLNGANTFGGGVAKIADGVPAPKETEPQSNWSRGAHTPADAGTGASRLQRGDDSSSVVAQERPIGARVGWDAKPAAVAKSGEVKKSMPLTRELGHITRDYAEKEKSAKGWSEREERLSRLGEDPGQSHAAGETGSSSLSQAPGSGPEDHWGFGPAGKLSGQVADAKPEDKEAREKSLRGLSSEEKKERAEVSARNETETFNVPASAELPNSVALSFQNRDETYDKGGTKDLGLLGDKPSAGAALNLALADSSKDLYTGEQGLGFAGSAGAPEIAPPGEPAPFSPQPANFDSVAYVRSPVNFAGIYSSRTPGARGSAVGRYGSGGAGGGGTESAVYRSLRWMKEKQGKDGSWNGNVEDTSVSLLAYLAHGETPASAEFGATTEKAIRALIDAQRPDGRFSDDPEVNDKAAYALNETYSMTKVPMVRDAAEKATKAVVSDQAKLKKLAGWHVSALKSAQMAGIGNGKLDQAIKEAGEKLKAEEGSAAVLGLQLLGHANDTKTREKLQALQNTSFELKADKVDDMLFTTQAKFHGGDTTFMPWNKELTPKLIKGQTVVKSASSDGKDLGFWPLPSDSARQKGDVYNTAIASLMETVYYRYLPTYRPPESDESTLAALSDKDEIKVLVEDKAVKAPEPDNMIGPRFKATGVNPMVTTVNQPFSTFSIDVDTASYTLSRNYMLKGQLPPAEAVRTEEFVNFFDYDYKPPVNKTFGVYIDCAPSKFGHGQQLLKIGVKGRRLGREEQRGAVLTILVDTSGSMNTPDRIELAKKSLRMLVERLGPKDTVALVQYDNHARVVLPPTKAAERKAILAAIDALQCNGSTNLEEGMQRAYEVAGANFAPGAENRVLLLSDGAANLGTTTAEDILLKVESFRKQGIFCSVFGMGQGTYNDEMLGTLADKGDGVYRFIDSEQEARQVFVDDLAATLNTIARDVKIQVEFNPANVKSYRQLGYEKRQLKTEDFRNDAVDAGEVGSGQSVTALYELDLAPQAQVGADIVCTVRVRYMRTDVKKIEEIEERFHLPQVGRSFDAMDARFRLAACAAETAEILRGSPFAAGSEWNDVAAALRPVALELSLDSRVAELLRLVQGAKDMARGE